MVSITFLCLSLHARILACMHEFVNEHFSVLFIVGIQLVIAQHTEQSLVMLILLSLIAKDSSFPQFTLFIITSSPSSTTC